MSRILIIRISDFSNKNIYALRRQHNFLRFPQFLFFSVHFYMRRRKNLRHERHLSRVYATPNLRSSGSSTYTEILFEHKLRIIFFYFNHAVSFMSSNE